ncbi:hypothetical protein [Bifidobacterium sp.]|uniref:hypothetical protein n=1 Tax=Bifidobacterium sp. TaxID=41200 RepID=UPI0039EC6E26
MHNTQTQGTGAATSQDEPKPRAKTKPRSPRRKKEDLSPEAFEDMIDPVGSYEDMLRLTVRRLKKSLASETTSDQALPALARQLLAASRELDQYDGSYEDTTADAMLEGVEEDDTFRIEDI